MSKTIQHIPTRRQPRAAGRSVVEYAIVAAMIGVLSVSGFSVLRNQLFARHAVDVTVHLP